ncbi:MAG: MgtC/SapB family protein [Nitrospirae bacterium]|nr:MgtC/SapB family protein [Nitrospirota bacterium]
MLDFNTIVPDTGKLLLAAVVGGAIGFEREAHGQAAGFRTYIIVCLGSCLMMLLSLHIEDLYRHLSDQSTVRIDPGRIASYAIASMGFLGAGAIIKGKGSVRGLTTAAGLWVVTGIGLSIGAGQIAASLITTGIILIVLYFAHPLRALSHRRIYVILTVQFQEKAAPLESVKDIVLGYPSFSIQLINFEQDAPANAITYRIRLFCADVGEKYWPEIVRKLSVLDNVTLVKWEESDVP